MHHRNPFFVVTPFKKFGGFLWAQKIKKKCENLKIPQDSILHHWARLNCLYYTAIFRLI